MPKGMLITEGDQASPTMTLEEIVTEVCKRVNDPFEDNYQDRARELFVASIFQGLKDPKWTKFDYHGFVGSRTFYNTYDKRVFSIFGENNDISGDSVYNKRYIMDIVDIVSTEISEDNAQTRKYVLIDTNEANRIATDADLEPIKGEVYWYIAGTKLYFHPSPGEAMTNQRFIIEYLINPLDFHYQQDMLKFLSATYIYDSIDSATGKLLAEIGLA